MTPDEAASEISTADPAALQPVAPEGGDGAPKVLGTDSGFETSDSEVESSVGRDPTDGATVSTASGDLSLVPQDVAGTATGGEIVAGGAAVGFANTSRDADTFVKPTEDGVETFTNVRSDAAPEEFTWNVDLEGDEQLQSTADGAVQVVDPTVDENAVGLRPDPAPVEKQTLSALQADGVVPADAAPADPGTDLSEPLSAAGVAENPLDADEMSATGQPAPTIEGTSPPAGATPPPDPAPSEDPELPASVQQRAATLDEQAKDQASSDLSEAAADQQTSAQARDTVQRVNPAGNPADESAVVATITAPSAKDGDGEPVDVSLSVHGDEITMHVPHDADTAYPIAADPYVLVEEAHWEWRYGPIWHPTPRQVGTRWSFDQIGAYWGAAVWWVQPWQRFHVGHGLYAVNFGWGWVYMNPYVAWSPIYTWVQHPVYSHVYDDFYAVWEPDRYVWTDLFADWLDLEDGAWDDDDPQAHAAQVGPGAGTPNQIPLQFAANNVVVRRGPSTDYGRAPAFDRRGSAITSPNFNKSSALLGMADVGDWVAVAAPLGGSGYYARGYVPQSAIRTSNPDWRRIHHWTRLLTRPKYIRAYTVSGGFTSVRNEPQGYTVGYLYEGDHFFDVRGGPRGEKRYLRGWASGGAKVNGWMPFCKVSGGDRCKPYQREP